MATYQTVSFAAAQSQVRAAEIERVVAAKSGKPRKLLSVLANKIGLEFNAEDERYVQESLEYSQTGNTVKWNNNAYGAVLTITPTYSFRTKSDIQCRGYKVMMLRGAKQIAANDTACRYESGWFAGASNGSVPVATKPIALKPVKVKRAVAPKVVSVKPVPAAPRPVVAKPIAAVQNIPKVAVKPKVRVVPQRVKPRSTTPKVVAEAPVPVKVAPIRVVPPVTAPVIVKRTEPTPTSRTPIRTPKGDESIYVTADTDLSQIPVIAHSANLEGALYKSTDTNVATVNASGKVSIIAIGTATIIVTIPGDANFNTAIDSYTLAVVRSDQADFSVGDDVKKTFGDGIFRRDATGGQGQGIVSYHSSNANVATVNPNTGEVVILGAGEATITATKIGDNNFNEISDSYDVIVAKADRSVFAIGGNEKRTYVEREFVKPIKTE